MRAIFTINYVTQWGENLFLVSDSDGTSHAMSFHDNFYWSCELEAGDDFVYHYEVKAGVRVRIEPFGHNLSFCRSNTLDEVTLLDSWQDYESDNIFCTSPFQIMFPRKRPRRVDKCVMPSHVTLRVKAPAIPPEYALAITGGSLQLGNWQPQKAARLIPADFPYWTVCLQPEGVYEFKFIVVDRESGELVAWEEGDNRELEVTFPHNSALVVTGLKFRNPLSKWKCAGTAVPLFALRTASDFGIGDFADIPKIVDWATRTGQHIIQFLPLNDTTSLDSCHMSHPYNPVSAFALHPIYVRPPKAGVLSDKKLMARFTQRAMHLNSMKSIDYGGVLRLKIDYMRAIYEDNIQVILEDVAFSDFVAANASWLRPYAAFCILRDSNETQCFEHWGAYSVYDEDKVSAFLEAQSHEANFVFFYQYTLHKQLAEAVRYAHEHNVLLKGDLPIGVSPHSVDVWCAPAMFDMSRQAGAPPDYFSQHGQVWGFPLYDWKAMEQDGYSWFKARVRNMAQYFDCCRLDHVMGYFRMWAVPLGQSEGACGHYVPCIPDVPIEVNELLWKQNGLNHLGAIVGATSMLLCGENIGTVPAGADDVLKQLGVLSLEIQQLPRDGYPFRWPDTYPYMSVCSTSNHDMNVLRSWWKHDYTAAQQLYDLVLHHDLTAPDEATPDMCEEILAQNLGSSSMLAIFPIQDWLSIDADLRNPDPDSERVNNPMSLDNRWDYRMHIPLETLVAAAEFNKRVRMLIAQSGR